MSYNPGYPIETAYEPIEIVDIPFLNNLTVVLAIPADCLEQNHLPREVPELAIDDFSDYEDDEHARRSSWTVWGPALKAAMDSQN